MVRTVGIGGQEAAAVGRDHLQPREAVERAFEDQVRESDGRSQGIADGVGVMLPVKQTWFVVENDFSACGGYRQISPPVMHGIFRHFC